MEPLTYTVPAEEAGCTVQHILESMFLMSRSHISRLKRREGGIMKNGQKCYSTARCREGDIVTALISDAPDSPRLEPMQTPLEIAYEDEWLIIINKPAGMTVHPERSGVGGSVENALSAYFKQDEFCHTVSRLDRGTSGLMTVAKCGYMHERMRALLHTDGFIKEYLGITVGCPQPEQGVITLPLRHVEGSHYKMEAVTDAGEGAESATEYRVMESSGGLSLVRLLPLTGRMHQLRVHMAAVGCPLVGDWLYGEESPLIERPALHSHRLEFVHPLTGERVWLEAELPRDMAGLYYGGSAMP